MDKLDFIVKSADNAMKHEKWQQYFNLWHICSKEYAKLIRL
jgi:hypothetical protein